MSAPNIAKKLSQHPGVLVAMVDTPSAPCVVVGTKPAGYSDELVERARTFATAAAEASARMAGEMPSKSAQIDMRTADKMLKAVSEARADVVVTVVIPLGHPISKSLQRMVRRAIERFHREATATEEPSTPTAATSF